MKSKRVSQGWPTGLRVPEALWMCRALLAAPSRGTDAHPATEGFTKVCLIREPTVDRNSTDWFACCVNHEFGSINARHADVRPRAKSATDFECAREVARAPEANELCDRIKPQRGSEVCVDVLKNEFDLPRRECASKRPPRRWDVRDRFV